MSVCCLHVRGYTGLAERTEPHALSLLLRRFYSLAEEAFFPEALIDKLIGDSVMALYVPLLGRLDDPAGTMVDHAEHLLTGLGYGSIDGPVLEVGIGIDFGEAFVGNIGERWLYDFTAVGDVVNTAARLESAAGGGEILVSDRRSGDVALGLRAERVEIPPKREARELAAMSVSSRRTERRPASESNAEREEHYDEPPSPRSRERDPDGVRSRR